MKKLLTLGCALMPMMAVAQSGSKLFLVGAEPANADMSFIELAWLPAETAIAPGLTGVLERDERLPAVMETCSADLDFETRVAGVDNTFGGFSIELGFDAAQNADFEPYLACVLDGLKAVEPDERVFLTILARFYEGVNFLGYAFSLMTEFGYGLAREEFADPEIRPSELSTLTMQDYRGVWPSLFDTSDLYVTAISSSGVADLLVAVDNLVDKSYGRPEQAKLPEQPPYNAAPLEGLVLAGLDRPFIQINRVFAPSIPGSIAEGSALMSITNQRLDVWREEQGIDPAADIFKPVEPAEEAALGEEAELPELATTGLLGISPSFFADKKYLAAFTFMTIYADPQPMAATVDAINAGIDAALSEPITQEEFDAAVAELAAEDCAAEPIEGMAQTSAVWLREDLFHGRADTFISSDIFGCETMSLTRLDEVRDATLNDSETLVFGLGGNIIDNETLDRPFCVVEDLGQLEFECSDSEFQL